MDEMKLVFQNNFTITDTAREVGELSLRLSNVIREKEDIEMEVQQMGDLINNQAVTIDQCEKMLMVKDKIISDLEHELAKINERLKGEQHID